MLPPKYSGGAAPTSAAMLVCSLAKAWLRYEYPSQNGGGMAQVPAKRNFFPICIRAILARAIVGWAALEVCRMNIPRTHFGTAAADRAIIARPRACCKGISVSGKPSAPLSHWLGNPEGRNSIAGFGVAKTQRGIVWNGWRLQAFSPGVLRRGSPQVPGVRIIFRLPDWYIKPIFAWGFSASAEMRRIPGIS
jgi:hypothetical protein